MATAATGWVCTHSASIIAQTDTTATIRVECFWQNQGWNYHVNLVSAWVYCNGQEVQVKFGDWIDSRASNSAAVSCGYHDYTINKGASTQNIACYAKIQCASSYSPYTRSSSASTVSVGATLSYTIWYDANGGSGAPSAQTKWHNQNIALQSGIPSRDGHNFVHWNTNNANTGTSYNPGATYSANASVTLYAIWSVNSYTISYNANGGTGAPGNQTKTHGVNLTLSSAVPTRANYRFMGWSTSANGGVVYSAGAIYSGNASITLYAVWSLAYTAPRITNISAYRCDASGNSNETGTYLRVSYNWATDYSITGMRIQWKVQSIAEWSMIGVSGSGTSGYVSQVVGGGGISVETSYHVVAYVSDSGGETYSTILSVGTVRFPIDVKAGGTGVAIGKVAESDNLFDVGLPTNLRSTLNVANNITSNGNITGVNLYGKLNGTCVGGRNYLINSKNAFVTAAPSSNYNQYNLYSTHPLCGKTVGVNLTYTLSFKFIPAAAGYKPCTSVVVGGDSGNSWQCRVSSWDIEDFGDYYVYSKPFVIYGTHSQYLQWWIKFIVESYDTSAGGTISDVKLEEGCNRTDWTPNDCQILPITLYDNTSGTTGNITLAETAANYAYLEIFYRKGVSFNASTRVYAPEGKSMSLMSSYYSVSEGLHQILTKVVYISGTTVSVVSENTGLTNLNHDNVHGIWNSNEMSIYKIIGYKL